MGRFGSPKWHPKRPQNESKIKTKNTSLFYPSWSCLGGILGDLGRGFVAQKRSVPSRALKKRKTKNNRFKTHFGFNLARFGVPKGSKKDPKTDPKRDQNRPQNRSEKKIEKWTAQSSMAGIGGGHAWPRGPPGGGRGRFHTTSKRPVPKI